MTIMKSKLVLMKEGVPVGTYPINIWIGKCPFKEEDPQARLVRILSINKECEFAGLIKYEGGRDD